MGSGLTDDPTRQRRKVLDYLRVDANRQYRAAADDLADGYGPIAPDDPRRTDWQHIAGSSDAGIKRIYDYLRSVGAI